MNYITDPDTRTGTLTGTMLAVFNIDTTQLLSTIILAATGALVSFLVSVGCKYLWRRRKKEGQ